MRVLMLTPNVQRVGTWYRAFNLASALVRRGHCVRVVKVGLQRLMPREQVEGGVSVLEVPRFWGSSLFYQATRMPHDILARIGLQLFKNADVVHAFTHHLNALLPALVGRWLKPRTLVLGDRDDLWAEGGLRGGPDKATPVARVDYLFHRWTEYNMARWLGAMTVVSDDLMNRVSETGVGPPRVRKIINGCPSDRIRPGDRKLARASLGLPQERSILLFVGVGQYDIDLILDALKELKARAAPEAMPLTILIGPHEDSLRARARERGLGHDVIATGFLADTEIQGYLQAADVGLLPFADKPLNWARFPIKIGDYLAAGLPIITNQVGEMGKIVHENDVGLVTDPNPIAYAAGIQSMLDRPEQREAWRLRARAAAERLSWDQIGHSLEEFYLDLSSASR